MGLDNNPGDNRSKDDGKKNGKGEGGNQQPADSSQHPGFEGVTLPGLGRKVAQGHYVASLNGEVVSAGTVDVHEEGLRGEQVIDGDTLRMYGITDEKGAFRALTGDNGSARAGSSQTSVGYNPKYARGWDNLFGKGPSSN